MARSRAPGVPKTMSTRTTRSSTAEKRKRSPEAESAPAPAPAPKKARSATKAAPKKAAAAKKTVVSKVGGKAKIAEPAPTPTPSSPASSILSDLSEAPTELMTPSPPHTPVPIVTRALAPVSDRAAAPTPTPTPAPVTVRAPAAPAPVPATVITAPSPAAHTPAVSAKAPAPTPEPHPETLSPATHASIVAAVREVILPCLDLVEPMLEHTRACAKLPAGSKSEKMSYVDQQEARVLGVLANLRQQFGGVEREEGAEVIVDEQREVEGAEERKDGGEDARGEEGLNGEVGQAEETVAEEEVAEVMIAKKKKKSPKRKTELELLGSPQGLTGTRSRASRV